MMILSYGLDDSAIKNEHLSNLDMALKRAMALHAAVFIFGASCFKLLR
jgi:hypothetical protein